MQTTFDPRIDLPIAALALITAVGIWYYLLRPVPELEQNGVVQDIQFFGKELVEKTEIRDLRNSGGDAKKYSYTLPDRFIYIIKLDDGKIARYEENALHSEADPDYKVGAKLSVSYKLRKLPFGKEKLLVLDVK